MALSWKEKIRRKLVRTNRIYIMPTVSGVIFLVTMVVMVLVAATYNNNMIFVLAFLLFAIFFVCMLHTHFNLKGVRVKYLASEEGFEGEPLQLSFHVLQSRRRPKPVLHVRSASRVWVTVAPGITGLTGKEPFVGVQVAVKAWRRGVHAVPDFILETSYPLGLFRAWKVFRPSGEIVVYPKPEGGRALEPISNAFGEDDLGLRASPEGDFGELKPYLPGESYHQIAWKQFARLGNLYSKVHWGEDHRHYFLPWNPGGAPTEVYLRQMSQWVKIASEENATFSMDLPGQHIDSGTGYDHARTCWQALARLPHRQKAVA